MAMKESTVKVLNYLKEIGDANVTAGDIAVGLGADPADEEAFKAAKRSVDGSVTAGLCRKGLAERIPAQIEVDGVYKDVKFIKLTEEGKAFIPGVTDAEPAAE